MVLGRLDNIEFMGKQIDELCDNLDNSSEENRIKATFGLRQLLRTDQS